VSALFQRRCDVAAEMACSAGDEDGLGHQRGLRVRAIGALSRFESSVLNGMGGPDSASQTGASSRARRRAL
jgi:hypothetical protein